ncbi:uncharacterized protein PAC_17357 [Phialocephala subalpina]|uniref:Uncharacterized protein n=1 Tax=Phialocephala subalpina TaxID=576137 RepID=A0A1L7XR75_9HELO|nr:uncharacterized protein PAC_17357 [Phialocephala subalpina]
MYLGMKLYLQTSIRTFCLWVRPVARSAPRRYSFGPEAGLPIGLLSLTITILDSSLAYYSSAKDASKSMSHLLKEVISLKSVLSSIQDNVVTNLNVASAFRTAPSSSVVSHVALELLEYNFGKSTPGILDECNQFLKSILERLQKGLRANRGASILKRLTWPFTEKEVLKEAIRNDQREWHAERSKSKILEWLSPLDFQNKHLDVAAKRQPGTADWVLDSKAFLQWMEEDLPCGNILWCPGDPGVGKTVITSNVIDHLLNLQGTRDIGVTYLYCDYHNEMNTTPTVLIGSLTRQLVQNQTLREFPNELFLEFSRARDSLSTLTVHEHLELFRSIAANISECYIVIDALDELENRHNATRSNMIAALKEISKDSVHVFITSRRFHEDINVAFHSALRIDITAKDEDIERFLRSKIKQNRDLQELFQEDGSLEDEIVKTILKKAGQQFLLPALHINRLADVTCIEEIKESLDDMATTLESTYDQAIARIQRQSHYRCALALNVLLMISFSKRPLRVAELREALAVKQNSSSISPGSLRTSKILLDVCIGLVIIEEKTDVIKLVHYTAYEYLRRSALFPTAEFEIAQRCLTYLQFDSFASGPQADARLYQARLETYPFFEYAASYFGHHAAALTMDVLQDELATLTLRFLRLPSNLASAIQAQFGTYNSRQPHKANYSVSASALWFAARFGLARIVRLLLQSGVDIDGKTFYGETALHEASSRGHLAIVQLLLDNGADINIPRGFVWQAEEFFNNQEKGTKELHKQLEGDLKITRYFGCPTCHRPGCQCLYFIKDNRVNSIASEISLDARLLKAAREGNETKALQLLASGADAKASDSIDRTILHWSVFSGLERLAHEALKRGCEVDAMDSAERAEQTALLEIARHPNGSPIIMKLLLQYGADANRRGNQWFGFCSPLHECVLRGDYEKALILLDYGANSKLKDYIGQEPIDIALRYKDMKMVTLLQEQEVASMYRETALHIAASKDHRDIVRLLLKMGADTRATTRNSSFTFTRRCKS